MDRRVAFLLAAMTPAGLAFSAFAQQGYPYMPANPGYAPAMPMQAPAGYAPMMPMQMPMQAPPGYAPAMPMQMPMQAPPGYGMYGQPAMPVMAVPVPYPVMVNRAVPMFGALETMPENGPLGAGSAGAATVQKPVEHVTAMKPKAPAPVAEPAKTPTPAPVPQPQPAKLVPQAAKPAAQPVAATPVKELGALASQSDEMTPTTPTVTATPSAPAVKPAAAPAKTNSQAEMLKYYVHEDTN
jgi:hypothetical protein